MARPGPPAPDVEVPFVSAAALELIAGRLESVIAHDAISYRQTNLVGRTVQAELQRVSRFARAVAITGREAAPERRPVTTGDIAAAIRSSSTRIARLAGMECVVTTHEAGVSVDVERALVVQAIVGTVDALLDLALTDAADNGPDGGARIVVSLETVRVRPALIVDIACTTPIWRDGSIDCLFDNDPQEFIATPSAGILLASAAHAVRLHGGRVEAQRRDGLSVRFVFPADVSRPTPIL